MTIDSYDSVVVETQSQTRSRGGEGERSDAAAIRAFEPTMSAELSEQVLAIEDRTGQREFARASVREVKVVENAPERPWLIAGITLAAGIFGALGGYMVGPTCPPDTPCMDWGAPVLGFALGTGVGLALSFPLTGELGDWKYARRERD